MDLNRSMEEAAKRAAERARKSRTIRGYGLDGSVVFEANYAEDRRPYEQIRTIDGAKVKEAEALGIRSVDDADRAGRSDFVRCFMFDPTHPPCYREVRGGHDRLPDAPIDAQWRFDFTGYEWMPARMHEICKLFPEDEIIPTQALLYAYIERMFEEQLPPEDATVKFDEMLEKTGLSKRYSPVFIAECVARGTHIRQRLEEIEAKAAKP